MIFLQSVLTLIIVFAIISIHIATLFLKEKTAKICTYVNIGLHILLFPILLIENIPIDEAVMLYMISIFAYLFPRFASSLLEKGGRR